VEIMQSITMKNVMEEQVVLQAAPAILQQVMNQIQLGKLHVEKVMQVL